MPLEVVIRYSVYNRRFAQGNKEPFSKTSGLAMKQSGEFLEVISNETSFRINTVDLDFYCLVYMRSLRV